MMMFFGSHTVHTHPRLHRQHHKVAQVQVHVPAQASAATATEDDEQEDQFGGHDIDDNDESALVTTSHCVQQLPKLLVHDQRSEQATTTRTSAPGITSCFCCFSIATHKNDEAKAHNRGTQRTCHHQRRRQQRPQRCCRLFKRAVPVP